MQGRETGPWTFYYAHADDQNSARASSTACLLLDGPVEGVERENTKFGIMIPVCTTAKKELGKLGDVLAKERDFLNVWRRKDVIESTKHCGSKDIRE